MKESKYQYYYVRITGDIAEGATEDVPSYHQSLSRTYTIPAVEFTPTAVAACVNHFCDDFTSVRDLHVTVA